MSLVAFLLDWFPCRTSTKVENAKELVNGGSLVNIAVIAKVVVHFSDSLRAEYRFEEHVIFRLSECREIYFGIKAHQFFCPIELTQTDGYGSQFLFVAVDGPLFFKWCSSVSQCEPKVLSNGKGQNLQREHISVAFGLIVPCQEPSTDGTVK